MLLFEADEVDHLELVDDFVDDEGQRAARAPQSMAIDDGHRRSQPRRRRAALRVRGPHRRRAARRGRSPAAGPPKGSSASPTLSHAAHRDADATRDPRRGPSFAGWWSASGACERAWWCGASREPAWLQPCARQPCASRWSPCAWRHPCARQLRASRWSACAWPQPSSPRPCASRGPSCRALRLAEPSASLAALRPPRPCASPWSPCASRHPCGRQLHASPWSLARRCGLLRRRLALRRRLTLRRSPLRGRLALRRSALRCSLALRRSSLTCGSSLCRRHRHLPFACGCDVQITAWATYCFTAALNLAPAENLTPFDAGI